MAKQPLRPSMAEIDIIGEAPPLSSTVSMPSKGPEKPAEDDYDAPPPEPRRQLAYRPTVTVAERLRAISYKQRRPIQELIDEAVLLWLSKQR